MRKIKVLFLDVEKEAKAFQALEIEDDYEQYLKILRIDALDIVRRNIAGKPYQIVVDDNGLLKNAPICSVEDHNGYPELYGNIIITGLCDNEGNLTSLTQEDIENICKKLYPRFSFIRCKEYHRLRLSK